jgi:hypothetical protein
MLPLADSISFRSSIRSGQLDAGDQLKNQANILVLKKRAQANSGWRA